MKHIKLFEEFVNETKIKSEEEFKKYAKTVLKKAFGEDYDETKGQKVIDGILNKADGDYGAAVGMLTGSLGESVNEKVYRLTGPYAAKGIIGSVMQAFKKEIEKISHQGDSRETLSQINKVWDKWAPKDGAKIILDNVFKIVKNKDEVAFITARLAAKWELNSGFGGDGTESVIRINIPMDFVINVGFMDDADASRYYRRLGGMTNTPLFNSEEDIEIFGVYDSEVGYNNIEIRGRETLMIDEK